MKQLKEYTDEEIEHCLMEGADPIGKEPVPWLCTNSATHELFRRLKEKKKECERKAKLLNFQRERYAKLQIAYLQIKYTF